MIEEIKNMAKKAKDNTEDRIIKIETILKRVDEFEPSGIPITIGSPEELKEATKRKKREREKIKVAKGIEEDEEGISRLFDKEKDRKDENFKGFDEEEIAATIAKIEVLGDDELNDEDMNKAKAGKGGDPSSLMPEEEEPFEL